MARCAGWRQWLIAAALAAPQVAPAEIDPAPPSPDLLLFLADSEEAIEDAPMEPDGDNDVDIDALAYPDADEPEAPADRNRDDR